MTSPKVGFSSLLHLFFHTKLTGENFAVAGAVIRAQIPPALCPTPASLEIIKGLLSKLFDYGAPLKIFACAGALLAYLPRTEEFAEQWRLMRPANPPVAFWDADDPEGE